MQTVFTVFHPWVHIFLCLRTSDALTCVGHVFHVNINWCVRAQETTNTAWTLHRQLRLEGLRKYTSECDRRSVICDTLGRMKPASPRQNGVLRRAELCRGATAGRSWSHRQVRCIYQTNKYRRSHLSRCIAVRTSSQELTKKEAFKPLGTLHHLLSLETLKAFVSSNLKDWHPLPVTFVATVGCGVEVLSHWQASV